MFRGNTAAVNGTAPTSGLILEAAREKVGVPAAVVREVTIRDWLTNGQTFNCETGCIEVAKMHLENVGTTPPPAPPTVSDGPVSTGIRLPGVGFHTGVRTDGPRTPLVTARKPF